MDISIHNCHMLLPNWHFSLSAKIDGTQRRALVSPWRMHCAYCGICQKALLGPKQYRTMKKIKHIILAFVKLHLSVDISQSGQSVSQSVIQLVENSVNIKKFHSNSWKAFWFIWKLAFCLSNPASSLSWKSDVGLSSFFHGTSPNLCGLYCTV